MLPGVFRRSAFSGNLARHCLLPFLALFCSLFVGTWSIPARLSEKCVNIWFLMVVFLTHCFSLEEDSFGFRQHLVHS